MLQGLVNIGNTCSINTLIQCLGNCSLFRKYILDDKCKFIKSKDKQYSIGEELQTILKQMWIEKHSLIPKRFLNAIQETLGDMYQIGREQIDFTEVLMILFHHLTEESHDENIQLDFYNEYTVPNDILQHIHTKAVTTWKTHNKQNNSLLLNILQGTQIQQIECKDCNKMYHNIEPFKFIYLDIDKTKEKMTFHDCLTKLFGIEKIPDWKCDKCNSSNNEKALRLWSMPKVFIFIINRIYGMEKVNTPLDIPLRMSFTAGVELKNPTVTNTYRLTAIANHYGNSIHYGHYNAICSNEEGNEWYMYDDMNIQKINDINGVLNNNKNVYALFYEQY